MSKQEAILTYLLVLSILLTVSIRSAYASPATCNPTGAISCSNLPAGSDCIYPSHSTPVGVGTIDCVVNTVQNVNTVWHDANYYLLRSLTIQSAGNIHFYYSTSTGPILTEPSPHYAGGGRGARGVSSYSPYYGGSGGMGGNTSDIGESGDNALAVGTSSPNCGGSGAGQRTEAGANVFLIAQTITFNNGILDVSGYPGNRGGNAFCNNILGFGGGGGSGGSGAGTIVLAAATITGTGQILAIGGRGGDGGSQNTGGSGSQCTGGSGLFPGGAGGAGGGGAGGYIYYTNTLIPGTITTDNTGGAGGTGGCQAQGLAEAGGNGGQANPTPKTAPTIYTAGSEDCNNGIDDNLNNLIDMDDPDCYGDTSWDWSPVVNQSLHSSGVYNPSAKNGLDAACGDDSLSNKCIVKDSTACSSCSNCDTQYCIPEMSVVLVCMSCKIDPAKTCDKFTDEVSCDAATYCQWNTGFDFLHDYGFIDLTKEYLCYNNITLIRKPSATDAWNWLDGKGNDIPFKIYALNNSAAGKVVDVISNSETWSYCNANPSITTGLRGDSINEYESFGQTYPPTQIPCYVLANMANPSANFSDCSLNGGNPNCCSGTADVTVSDTFGNCLCNVGTGNQLFCTLYPDKCNPNDANTPGGGTYIDKDSCKAQMACLNSSLYDPSAPCGDLTGQNGQPGGLGHNCAAYGLLCSNGTYVSTSDTKHCCYGPDAQCISAPSTCDASQGWNVYTPDTQYCSAGNFQIGATANYCCLGPVYNKPSLTSTFANSVLNNSFICFKQNNNSLLSDCCFGSECANLNLIEGLSSIDYTKSRVESAGSALHTVSNYNVYDATAQRIVDYIYRIIPGSNNKVDFIINNKLNMSGFTYLEFDVGYENKYMIRNIIINGRDYGPLFDYLTNGNAAMRWHHAIVPINSSEQNDIIQNISINLTGKTTVSVDDIFLMPNQSTGSTDLNSNSKNYYCTGGFGSWIPDLSPNLTQHPFNDAFFVGADAWTSGYGRYAIACDAKAAFSWTGHQCCGANTRNNYGEFFNDTEGGCFNASYIINNQSVALAYNVNEIIEPSEFESFSYKNLLYFNNTFISCQESQGQYNNLKVSYDGTLGFYPPTDQLSKLVNNKKNNECAVVGSYYCSDLAWRQKIIAPDYVGNPLEARISFKSIPPGGELVYNGDFGGSCSDGVKNGDETDKDCGGSCQNKCAAGQVCASASDCNALPCNCGICGGTAC